MALNKQPKPKPAVFIGIHLPPDTLVEIRKAAALKPSTSKEKSVSGLCRATLVKAFPTPSEKA